MPRHVAASQCVLGEGPLWFSDRIFWCDITAMRLLSCRADGTDFTTVQFNERISALAHLKDGGLLVASETGLFAFDPNTGARRDIAPLEATDPNTRSNDGRADLQGGFWIGTMGLQARKGDGTFYRFHRGKFRLLLANAHIPNAQCFSPDGKTAYFSDTTTHLVMRWNLDTDGWPIGDPQVHLDFRASGMSPDGAVVDMEGGLWCAFYGSGQVIRFAPDGRETHRVTLPASQVTCPAFGGSDRKTLFVTSARQNLPEAQLAREPQAGDLFAFDIDIPGLPEPLVDA